MKLILILILSLFVALILIFLYCALRVAADSDRWMEEHEDDCKYR